MAEVEAGLLAVGGVRAVSELHAWSLSGTHSLVSVHVATGERSAPAPEHVNTRIDITLDVLLLSSTVKMTVNSKLHYVRSPTAAFTLTLTFKCTGFNTLLSEANFKKYICQKKEKQQYTAVGTVRMFIEPNTKY